jgi:hypothetical protein
MARRHASNRLAGTISARDQCAGYRADLWRPPMRASPARWALCQRPCGPSRPPEWHGVGAPERPPTAKPAPTASAPARTRDGVPRGVARTLAVADFRCRVRYTRRPFGIRGVLDARRRALVSPMVWDQGRTGRYDCDPSTPSDLHSHRPSPTRSDAPECFASRVAHDSARRWPRARSAPDRAAGRTQAR